MKYIDADLLRNEIERRIDILSELSIEQQKEGDSEMSTYYHGKAVSLEELLYFIDSLQQEQPDFPTTDKEVTEFLATHPKVEVPKKYKTPDWLWNKQEQLEVNFEKELKSERTKLLDVFGPMNGEQSLAVKNFARHFVELGQRIKYQQDRAEFAKLKAKEWMNGYDEGYAKGLTKKQSQIDWESEIEEYWIASGWNKVIPLSKFKVIARYFIGLALEAPEGMYKIE